MKRDSVLSLVGIATKAGRIASGEFLSENAVKSGKASLVIISREASENTEKKFRNMCSFYQVPAYSYGNREELGAASGNEYRAVLAVLDVGLADALMKKLETAGAEGGYENGGNRE